MKRRSVVGAAVLRDGRVLAARRTAPVAAAGRWELPGGKVEAGETPEAALVREVREELGCDVRVDGWLRGRVPVGERYELSVALVALVAGEPVPVEHDQVRWLGPDELDGVDWLEPDRPFLAELRKRMMAGMGGVRAIFFDEDHAAAAVARLQRDGHTARAERERFAGEDDDEDHPWAVVSDAPAIALELLVDEYDGWLDIDAEPGPPAPPLDLPAAPRRHHRPPSGG